MKQLLNESIWDQELQKELDYSLEQKYGIKVLVDFKIYRHQTGEIYIIYLDSKISL